MDEPRGDRGGAGGDIDVEGKRLDRVALPRQQPGAGEEADIGDLVGAAERAMVAGDPFGEEQGQPGGTRRHRDRLGHPVNRPADVSGIDFQRDRAGIGNIGRRRDGRRYRDRQRSGAGIGRLGRSEFRRQQGEKDGGTRKGADDSGSHRAFMGKPGLFRNHRFD